MGFYRLLLRNLLFHRRGNLAVFLGVALGTAVLTGALLVGDSLKGSLTQLALDQLGWVENAMTANRFFRAGLARDIGVKHACPALMLRGSASAKQADKPSPVNKVTVLAVDHRFWPGDGFPASGRSFWPETPPLGKDFWDGSAAEVVLNQSLAEALHVSKGDTISLNLQKAENVPREFLLGKRHTEDVVEAVEVKVAEILPDRGMARFTLTPSPEPVRNAFVPLKFLQQKLNLVDRANAIFTAGADAAPSLTDHLQLADWGLTLLTPLDRAKNLARLLDPRNSTPGNIRRITGDRGWLGHVPDGLTPADKNELTREKIEEFYQQQRDYALLESQQLLLDDAVVHAVERALPAGDGSMVKIDDQSLVLCPLFIYLADSISHGKEEISYAVVAARGPLPDETPLGERQIDLAEYPQALAVKPGEEVTLSYFAADDHLHLRKLHVKFTVRKTFPLTGRFDDADLVPQVPGVTDKISIRDWDPTTLPFPYDPVRGNRGEKYWERYRGTPRAYISLATAQNLWGSRFGKLTSFQFVPAGGKLVNFQEVGPKIAQRIRQALSPEAGGFVWQDVRKQGEKAGGGSTDFGVYFLAFSFFLIVAALLLVGLLFRLNLDLRGREIGILLATGWTLPQVRRLLLCEGLLLAIFGALAGLGGSLVYADQLLKYLGRSWPGQQLLFLKLHATSASLAVGWSASVFVSFLTILWAVRILSRMTPVRLLAGDTTASAGARVPLSVVRAGSVGDGSGDKQPSLTLPARTSLDASSRRGRPTLSALLIPICAFAAGASLASGLIAKGQEAQAGSFFGGGFLVLVLGLILMWRHLRGSATKSHPTQSLAGLAVRNAGRHAVRSVLTIGLLGSATFLIVAVESFHKDAGAEFLQKTGGSGGFPLFAQADVPIFEDLNSSDVRSKLPFPRDSSGHGSDVTFYPCRLQPGDDASCLNLYQPQLKPRILGVPRSLIDRRGFSFDQTLAKTPEEKENPWLLLTGASGGKDAIPAFVDGNSAQYILHIALGQTYEVANDRGEPVKLRIVGLLHESVFQSEMVVSDADFRKLFPRQEGFSFFLIDGPKDETGQIRTAWEKALSDNGLSIETTTSRLEKYLAVENTYLATFQALGGLGLLLGAAGLAIVLLRSVWERRGELALLRALGFRRQALAWLVMVENAFLLLAGLTVGMTAALLAVAPHLAAGEAHVLGLHVLRLLAMVIAVGLAAGLAAVFTTLRAPLLPALRHE